MPVRSGSPPDARLSNVGLFAPPHGTEINPRVAISAGSSRTAASQSMNQDRLKMEAFRKIKPLCVALLGIAQTAPSQSTQHAQLLAAIVKLLPTFASEAFTPGMISYIMFPITSILRRSDPAILADRILEHSFEVLAVLVRQSVAVEETLWEQLWRFTVLSMGQGMTGSKGKKKELSQETQLAGVGLLSVLLDPRDGHPTAGMLEKLDNPKTPGTLLPTLFSTISILLDLCNPSSTNTPLQLQALASLRPLISVYLKEKPEMLASVLPGIVSTMTKVVAGKSLKGDAAESTSALLSEAVCGTLGDGLLRERGVISAKLNNLEQLSEWDKPDSSPAPSPSPAASATANDPFPPLTASYLAFTTTQLLSALPSILMVLSAQSSAQARMAAVDLAASLLKKCFDSLQPLHPHLLNTLLTATQDPFDPVRHRARRCSRQLEALPLRATMQDLLSNSLNTLPRLIMSEQSAKVEHTAKLITAIAEAFSFEGTLGEILGPTGGVEKWGWGLLICLEFGRPPGWEATNTQRAWDRQLGAMGMLIDEEESPATFPSLPLRYIDAAQTTKVLAGMFTALGAAGGLDALHTVDYFVRLAKAKRKSSDVAKAASALWVAERILDGLAQGESSKKLRKAVKEIARAVVEIDDDDDDEVEEVAQEEDAESSALIAVERTKGVHAITTLLDRTPRLTSAAASDTRKLHIVAQRGLVTALSLSLLATTARILSTSFRPLLLHSLYVLLSHLASPHALIQSFAEVALVRVAYHTGYASPQNLVLDNVDYVINVVSQRLTYKRLSSQAPLVLIAMIRMVGEPIVPLVHDIVDEIFDALDDFHGYESLASTLLAVLVTLIKAMEAEVEALGPSEEMLETRKMMHRVSKAPDAKADFEAFVTSFNDREEARRVEMEELLKPTPQEPWAGQEPPEAAPEEEEVPPTRAQEVCTQILRKGSYFLTHRSAFLRARVCALFASAVPVLVAGSRESDLLPIVNSAWPYILSRLNDPEPFVVTEAAALVQSLATYVGDFMAKRVLENAWPVFKKLLDAQSQADKSSALARRSGVGTSTAYSNSHRLHRAILSTMMFVAKEVPVVDEVLWQLIVTFRPFLDAGAHAELQAAAITLYTALAERDGDAVWAALGATVGQLETMSYLHEPMWNVGHNVEIVMSLC